MDPVAYSIQNGAATGQAEPKRAAILKLGIFVVAYHASSTIYEVLRRIKPAMWEQLSEIFIFDDSSKDATCDAAAKFKDGPYADKVKIFHNQVNLGYGGNQKRGYAYAVQHGFDIIVMLHGDGQYAPECLEEMLAPLVRGEAEAVFGSRMLTKGGARRGGMPLYKFLGNRILTVFQNMLLRVNFSEFHSGYRAYHVPSLAHLPLHKNSNDFHFDNEIILQFLEAGYRIKEVPIPTYYGDEICYVNGMKYAWNVVMTTLKYRLHKAGFLCYAGQFDLQTGHKYTFKRNRFSSHNLILNLLRTSAQSGDRDALDVGCGAGFLATKMANLGYRVVGVDVYENDEARKYCKQFHVCDVEKGFGLDRDQRFDRIVFADVLEHVRNPEQVLLRARRHLKPGGQIVASTGNVAHLYVRLALCFGWFTYTERGILDRTHVRLFTRKAFKQLFQDCSFRVLREKASPIPFENLLPGWPRLANALCALNMLFVWAWPSLFAYQTVVEVQLNESTPSELLRKEQIDAPFQEWVPPAEGGPDYDQGLGV